MDKHVFVSRMLSVGRREAVAAGAVMALITLGLAGAPMQRSRAGEPSRPSAGAGKIVFAAGEGNGMITRSIYVINDDGTGLAQLTSGSDSGAPAWSPDGSQIAFSGDPDGDFHYDIFVMNADGSGVVQVTGNSESSTGPSWSPDGARIAFVRGDSGESYRIMTMAAGGGDEMDVVPDGVSPNWSPDGSRIVFNRWSSNRLFAVLAGGGEPSKLIQGSGLAYEQSPEWSPNGNKVVFSGATMYGEIFVVGEDGENLTQVTDSPGESSEPTWSPDGNRIAFIEGGTALHTIGTGGTGEQTILNGSDILSDPDWFGTPGEPNPHGCTLFVPPDYPDNTPFEGTSGDDVICGTGSDDFIDGKFGNDTIYGEGGDDWLFGGGRGQDWIYGGAGSDFVDVHGKGKGHAFGGGGKDVLQGRDHAWNLLNGGSGRDCANAGKEDEVKNVEKVLYGKNCPNP